MTVSGENTILVTGATGQQGGAVAWRLLRQGWAVRALTRNPSQPAAQALQAAGAELVQADFGDRGSLDEAMRGAHGVFAVTNFWDGFPHHTLGFTGEIEHGQALAAAAQAAGVRHFIFSSVGGAFAYPSKTPHCRSKQEIERFIRSISLPCTFLRPVFFMDNFNAEWLDFGTAARAGRIDLPLAADDRLQMVATEDVGVFAELAFRRRDDFLGAAFDLAGDELTPPEIAATFARVTGHAVDFTGGMQLIPQLRQHNEEFALMWEEFHERGTNAFLPGLRALNPQLQRLEDFLKKSGWAQQEAS